MRPDCHAALRRLLLEWFALHRRALPWRTDYTPYRTWIAEVMMQQTQMDRGVQYFERWMQRFPDIASVAAAPEEDLLKAWEGLGYYRRARNIQAAAKAVMEQHQGIFPSDHAAILALPGIGEYTAGAIASTAFNQDIPCVDGNVERVLARLEAIRTPVRENPARTYIRELAARLIPPGMAREFNQSLMELGALVCRKKPLCASCPLQALCEARKLGLAEALPVPGSKASVSRLVSVCGMLLHGDHLFIQRRGDSALWAGLWEFPGDTVRGTETPEQAIVRAMQEKTGFAVRPGRLLKTIRHTYTTHRITLHCLILFPEDELLPRAVPPRLTAAVEYRWILPEQLADVAFPAPHRILADAFFDKATRKA